MTTSTDVVKLPIDSIVDPEPDIEYYYNVNTVTITRASTFPFLKDSVVSKLRDPVGGAYRYRNGYRLK